MFDKVSVLIYLGFIFFKNVNIDYYDGYQFLNVLFFFVKFVFGVGLFFENFNLFFIKRFIKILKIFLYGVG